MMVARYYLLNVDAILVVYAVPRPFSRILSEGGTISWYDVFSTPTTLCFVRSV
jgi:hypothetical protein